MPDNYTALRELEKKRYYQECLIRSLESKLDRIEPLSMDFNETMESLFSAQDNIKEIGTQKIRLNIEKANT